MNFVIGITLISLLIAGVFGVVAADKPYYPSGDHIIKLVVKFDSDCWSEIYARATPKNNNHVLLNFQYIDNNDKPDKGPSEVLKLSWHFKEKKMEQIMSLIVIYVPKSFKS